MKKVLLLSSVLLLAFSAGVYAATDIKLYVNGKLANADLQIIDGSSYLPLRAVAELLGKDVTWDDKTRSIYVSDKSLSAVNDGEYAADQLSFYEVSVKKAADEWEVHAELRNDRAVQVKKAEFTASFYDANGKRVGVARGKAENLAPREVKTVTLTSLETLSGYSTVKFQIDTSE